MFKVLRGIALTASALVSVTTANAETAAMGLGIASCSVFAKQYQAAPDEFERYYFTWAQGFMSGLNALSLTEYGTSRDLGAIPTDEQELRLRSYCNGHPVLSENSIRPRIAS